MIDLSRIADDVVLGNDVSAVALVKTYGRTVVHDLMPRATREDGSLKTTEDCISARNVRTLDQGALT